MSVHILTTIHWIEVSFTLSITREARNQCHEISLVMRLCMNLMQDH